MSTLSIDVRGVAVPSFLYGTAWKEGDTEELVVDAIAAGFRGIDTANQRKHYFEEGVGRALQRCFEGGRVQRSDLFVQTKFTFRDGQDHRLPYDPQAPIAQQVAQSFATSLEHLGVEKIDSLVLHGPSQRNGLGAADREAWRAMEELAAAGKVTLLGISNVTAPQVETLVEFAELAPAFVQNRCYADRDWDGDVRAICGDRGIVYQAFSLLTANREVVGGPVVRDIAARHKRTAAQVIFRFAQQIGILPLTGTRDRNHMEEDLGVFGFDLDDAEVDAIRRAGKATRGR